MDKCQCQYIGDVSEDRLNEYNEVTERPYVNHAPDKCRCTNDLAFVDGKKIVLCSCCYVGGERILE